MGIREIIFQFPILLCSVLEDAHREDWEVLAVSTWGAVLWLAILFLFEVCSVTWAHILAY